MVMAMIIHIVRNNESVSDILDIYHLSFDDLKSNNLHITNFKKIIPGTKLKIPFLGEEIKQILESSESFVEDYYPVVERLEKENLEEASVSVNIEEDEVLFDNTRDGEDIRIQEPEEKIIYHKNKPVSVPEPFPYQRKSIYPRPNPYYGNIAMKVKRNNIK